MAGDEIHLSQETTLFTDSHKLLHWTHLLGVANTSMTSTFNNNTCGSRHENDASEAPKAGNALLRDNNGNNKRFKDKNATSHDLYLTTTG